MSDFMAKCVAASPTQNELNFKFMQADGLVNGAWLKQSVVFKFQKSGLRLGL